MVMRIIEVPVPHITDRTVIVPVSPGAAWTALATLIRARDPYFRPMRGEWLPEAVGTEDKTRELFAMVEEHGLTRGPFPLDFRATSGTSGGPVQTPWNASTELKALLELGERLAFARYLAPAPMRLSAFTPGPIPGSTHFDSPHGSLGHGLNWLSRGYADLGIYACATAQDMLATTPLRTFGPLTSVSGVDKEEKFEIDFSNLAMALRIDKMIESPWLRDAEDPTIAMLSGPSGERVRAFVRAFRLLTMRLRLCMEPYLFVARQVRDLLIAGPAGTEAVTLALPRETLDSVDALLAAPAHPLFVSLQTMMAPYTGPTPWSPTSPVHFVEAGVYTAVQQALSRVGDLARLTLLFYQNLSRLALEWSVKYKSEVAAWSAAEATAGLGGRGLPFGTLRLPFQLGTRWVVTDGIAASLSSPTIADLVSLPIAPLHWLNDKGEIATAGLGMLALTRSTGLRFLNDEWGSTPPGPVNLVLLPDSPLSMGAAFEAAPPEAIRPGLEYQGQSMSVVRVTGLAPKQGLARLLGVTESDAADFITRNLPRLGHLLSAADTWKAGLSDIFISPAHIDQPGHAVFEIPTAVGGPWDVWRSTNEVSVIGPTGRELIARNTAEVIGRLIMRDMVAPTCEYDVTRAMTETAASAWQLLTA